jgi:hypothetical protein
MTRRFCPSLAAELLEGRDVPATVLGLTTAGALIQIDPTNTTQVDTTPVTVTGLATGEALVGIDFAPNGTLYGLAADTATNTVHVYTINPVTGAATSAAAATAVGGTITGATQFAVDYNPVTNVLQVVDNLASDGNNTGNVNNFTVNPTTGAVTIQPDLVFPTGVTAPESAIAFTNGVTGATQTTLFGLVTGSSPDQLVINGAANAPGTAETITLVGTNLGTGIDATTAALDIGPNNTALAALTVSGTTKLYSVNLTTGAATAIGNVGTGGTPVADLAIAPAVAPFVGPVAVGGSLNGQVQLVTAANGVVSAGATVTAFGGLGVNVRATTADVNGDGIPDTIAVTGPGTAIQVKVISGADNTTVLVPAFSPFTGSEGFTGGGFVSAGDLDGDGLAEIVVSPDQGGGPRVTIFKPTVTAGTVTLAQVANFFGIDDPAFRGGARTALGDVNADGRLDLAVAAGFLGGPRVALFNGTTLLTTQGKLINDFFAFPGTDAVTLRNGTFVALGDLNGDGKADLIFGGGPGGAPRVFILDAATALGTGIVAAQASPLANFFVAGNSADRGGVRVAAADLDGDLRDDLIVGSGEGSPARVRVYLAKDFTGTTEPTTAQDLSVFGGAILTNGVFVG